jgi:hypothetical protein
MIGGDAAGMGESEAHLDERERRRRRGELGLSDGWRGRVRGVFMPLFGRRVAMREGAPEQRNLPGMVEVVLRQADELGVSGVRRFGHEQLVEALRGQGSFVAKARWWRCAPLRLPSIR